MRRSISLIAIIAIVLAGFVVFGWTGHQSSAQQILPAPNLDSCSPSPATKPLASEEPPVRSSSTSMRLAKRGGHRDSRFPPKPGNLALVFGVWERGGWSDIFAEPSATSIRLSQSLIGDQVKVLTQQGSWSKVEIISQGNIKGWISTAQLTAGSAKVRQAFNERKMLFVVATPGILAEEDFFVPFGSILPLLDSADPEKPHLLLPDGSQIFVEGKQVRPVDQPLSLTDALERLKSFRQVSYENGANSGLAMDAPGLIYLLFRAVGLSVPRTIEDLQKAGEKVSMAEARAGDVIFFSTFNPDQLRPVILLDNNTFIEASPARGVGLGLLEQMRNHTIIEVRRYVDGPLSLAAENCDVNQKTAVPPSGS
jgi:hypothetical protein